MRRFEYGLLRICGAVTTIINIMAFLLGILDSAGAVVESVRLYPAYVALSGASLNVSDADLFNIARRILHEAF